MEPKDSFEDKQEDILSMTMEELQEHSRIENKRVMNSPDTGDTIPPNKFAMEIERRIDVQEKKRKEDPSQLSDQEIGAIVKDIKKEMRSVSKNSEEYGRLLGKYSKYYKEMVKRTDQKS